MAFSKHLTIVLVIVCLASLVAGCGSDTVAPSPNQQAPLLPPLNLVASRTGDGSIMLAWQPNTQGNLIGYNVYRSVAGSTEYHRINPAIVVGTTYVDDSVSPNTRYEYRVTSVGSGGMESDYVSVSIYNGPNVRIEDHKKFDM